ncbi:hypothetical protein [Merismopedia glauca]|uniref:hypothetical protein n=1 Tax=Merismopedia glauca TaxID=292586 RepID=UPI0011B20111|nr:hypothetical protein [Merismopedia glauca]
MFNKQLPHLVDLSNPQLNFEWEANTENLNFYLWKTINYLWKSYFSLGKSWGITGGKLRLR